MMLKAMSVLVVAGLAFAASPLPATQIQPALLEDLAWPRQAASIDQDKPLELREPQQTDAAAQDAPPHQGDTQRGGDLGGRSHAPATTTAAPAGGPPSDCLLDEPQASSGSGPSQQEQDARRRTQKWWMSDEGRAAFGITDQQSKDLEAVFQSLLPRLRANKAELDRQEKVLSQLLNEANSDEALVVQAIDRVENARGALSRTRTLMLYRMYRLLSAEQRAKVQAYHERKSQESDNRTAQR